MENTCKCCGIKYEHRASDTCSTECGVRKSNNDCPNNMIYS